MGEIWASSDLLTWTEYRSFGGAQCNVGFMSGIDGACMVSSVRS